MPTKDYQQMIAQLNEVQRKDALSKNAEQYFKKNKKNYEKTISAQTNDLDKIYAYCLFDAKSSLRTPISKLDPAKQYELGYHPEGEPEDLTELTNAFSAKFINDTVSEPKKGQNGRLPMFDLEEVKQLFQNMGLINAKAAHDLIKERDEIYNSLGKEYDEQTKNDLADYLTSCGGTLAARTVLGTQTLQRVFYEKMLQSGELNFDYQQLLEQQLGAEFRTMLGEQRPPKMTVEEFMNAVHMPENARSSFFKKNDCSLKDSFYEVMLKNHDQRTSGKKLAALEGEAKQKRIDQLHDAVVNDMASHYVREKTSGWMAEGAERYEAGLQPSERKDFRKGYRLANFESFDMTQVKNRLKEKKVPFDDLATQLRIKNSEKTYKEIESKLTAGEPLKMRQAYGISESIKIPDADKRSFLMSGVVRSLESTGSTWFGHKKNSKTYEKMLTSMREYKKALESGEGGKARDLRKSVLNNCLAYVKDKGRMRRESNGQSRFDDAMTVLAMELPPEKFQLVCDELNKKRGEDEQIGVKDYDQYAKRCIDNEKNVEMEAQLRANSAVTESGRNNAQAINGLTRKFGPGTDFTRLPLVGRKEVLPQFFHLSDLDFTALSLGSSLSAPSGNHVAGQPLQELTAEAVKEGKNVTKAAMNAYGNGNKEPLAKLITQCLENMKTAAAEDRPLEEQACLDEMSTRLREMAARDPELLKIAVHNGMEAAPAENPQAQRVQEMAPVEADPLQAGL